MPKRYRIQHVRANTLIKKITFDIPDCPTNPDFPWIYPNTNLQSYDAYAQYVIDNSNGTITNFSDYLLYLTNVGMDLDDQLPAYGMSNKIDANDINVGDRFYINRWDNNHPYIEVVNKQISTGMVAFTLYYCLANGTVVYNDVGWRVTSVSAQDNTWTLPWCWFIDDASNLTLLGANIGIYTYQNKQIMRSTANITANPLSLENARKFWGFADIIDPTNPIPAQLTGIGGDGDFEFTGDNIDMPDAPDETVSGVLASGFLNIYKPSDSQLRSFGAALWTNAFNVKWFDVDSVANLVLNAVSNPIDFIVGLFMLPITPTVGEASGIFLGGINVNTISVPRVSKQYVTIDFGTINITELYGNYLDYSNSRISIYLPYVGMADIDVQEITGGSVTLKYIVDVFTGACVANVHCRKVTSTPWGESYQNETVHSYSGNMAIQLPISAGSFDTITQGLINVGLGLGTNTPAIAMTGAKDVISGFGGDVTTRGSLSSNTGKLGYQTPYLMFTRPIEARPLYLGQLHGYGADVGAVLSQLSGYVVCNDVKLDGVTATDSELNEIESILKSGVYV